MPRDIAATPGAFQRKPVLIDGSGHMMGRLAAFVAKSLLEGNKIKILRCEQITRAGPFYRVRHIEQIKLRRGCNVNPKRGPFHFRAPDKIFYKCVRGMLPIRTRRGREAMMRLNCYVGIPAKYAQVRPKVIPECMRVVRHNSDNKFCYLGRIAHRIGWQYRGVVERMERRRLIRKSVNIAHKKKVDGFEKAALKSAEKSLAKYKAIKAQYGY